MADPEPQIKGGGRGGPQRWTGKGPRPARHIPWPELFKHHESVLKGHLKMMDMVRKHCVEGSGNWNMAQGCVDRTHGMIREFKKTIYSFVPPPDNIDRVPVGASSASMYPGYSPADHIYGEAAQEYGQQYAEARQKNEIKTEQGLNGTETSAKERSSTPRQTNGTDTAMEDEEDVSALFTIDSNPTPLPGLKTGKRDRTAAATDEDIDSTPKKKKAKISGSSLEGTEAPSNDFEDAVVARQAKKEEKRRQKEEKKRKRQSDSSVIQPAAEEPSAAEVPLPTDQPMAERPKKKKPKKSHEDNEEPAVDTPATATPVVETKSSKKDKKRAKEDVEQNDVAADDGEKKKKRKKERAE